MPPSFGYPLRAAPWAEFEVAVYSDPEAVRVAALAQRNRQLPVNQLKMTVGKWRFRSRYSHQVHRLEEVKLGVKAALEEIVWRARLLPPFNPARPAFLGYATVPGCAGFPMRTYMVLELFPHNFSMVPRCDGPLLNHQQRQRFGADMEYADPFTAAAKRWVQDFGSAITLGWDEVVTADFNIVPVDSDSDESSLPLPVPAMLVESVLDTSQDSGGSALSNVAVHGSPVAAAASVLPAAAQAAFAAALAIIQRPLDEDSDEPMDDDTIEFIEE